MSELIVTLNTGGEKGDKGDVGERGDQGPRGATGIGQRGPQGERGPQGYGLGVHGTVSSFSELPIVGSPGDGWVVLEEGATQGDLYIWSGSVWQNAGPITGPQGPQGLPGDRGSIGPTWINWRNEWMNNTSYEIGDGVFYINDDVEGWTLRCRVPHTSGLVFSITNWDIILVSIPGPQGDTGAQGLQGLRGLQGDEGTPGLDGMSAYQIAVASGFSGSEGDWLASLVGPRGQQGLQGNQGIAGVNAITVVFTDEVAFNAYEPQFNEIAILTNA